MKKKILVADDDQSILEVVRIVLTEGGFEVISTPDGSRVSKLIAENNPDLVMLDIWMLGYDGREIAKKIKKDSRTRKIPVIVLSALGETKQIAKEIGADNFIEKPFDINFLLNMIKKYV